jgi:hypothetical protein
MGDEWRPPLSKIKFFETPANRGATECGEALVLRHINLAPVLEGITRLSDS